VAYKETAVAKAKNRVARRKKGARGGKAGAKPTRKKTARRATAKKTKSKIRRAGRGALKSTAKKEQPLKTAARKSPRKKAAGEVGNEAVEDTIFDVLDEPVPGVIRVTEYESVQPTSPDDPEKNNN
jgi:hypothetical protein